MMVSGRIVAQSTVIILVLEILNVPFSDLYEILTWNADILLFWPI